MADRTVYILKMTFHIFSVPASGWSRASCMRGA